MFKVDLHTHSVASHDGGISLRDYERTLDSGLLDCIAITDHNRIDFAQKAQEQLGDRIIVGEEIMTTNGEVIGLFLTKPVPAGLMPKEAIKQIKDQGGIVYIPHPFETIRKGIHPAILDELADDVDIIEICNGRAFLQNRRHKAVVWTKINRKLGGASSDAHGYHGLGSTYTRVDAIPTRETFIELFTRGIPIAHRPSVRALAYPKYNVLRKRFKQ
ncbi:MAG: putative metal-dependent phosphoesterase family [Candidatus Saccharibacteria bacterium]|nr:putative metal-dependent phosphoesterase family [Candidatus Saccharibacteria bacterium]